MHIRLLKSNVLLLLIGNNYVALILTSITLFDASLAGFLGNINHSPSFGIPLCQIRAYAAQYILSEYRCSLPLDSLRVTLMTILLLYMLPMSGIFIIYFYIIRYIRRTTQALQARQNRNRRDLIVFKRIIILFIILQILSIPAFIAWLLYIITGYTVSCSYYLEIFVSSISQFAMSLVVASTTPKIYEKFKLRQRQVHPSPVIRVRYHNANEFDRQNHEESMS
ncbi:unnamed protein product [Rotaria socialis]